VTEVRDGSKHGAPSRMRVIGARVLTTRSMSGARL
jgi:hypothetical protein